VIYSIIANSTMADVMPDVAPLGDEPSVLSGPDKFLNTDLAKILKDKGIQTVIVTGTASNGAVLFTGARAAFRGMNVIVPVDGMSAVSLMRTSRLYTFPQRALVVAQIDTDQDRYDQVLNAEIFGHPVTGARRIDHHPSRFIPIYVDG